VAFAIFASFYVFVASNPFSNLFGNQRGHQTIQGDDKIKSTRFDVRVPLQRQKRDSCTQPRAQGFV
jgi:hypothetical protein